MNLMSLLPDYSVFDSGIAQLNYENPSAGEPKFWQLLTEHAINDEASKYAKAPGNGSTTRLISQKAGKSILVGCVGSERYKSLSVFSLFNRENTGNFSFCSAAHLAGKPLSAGINVWI